MVNKEKCRFMEIEVEKSFIITLDEWKKMIENRVEHHFKYSFYKDVILEKLRTLYSGCVPCISNPELSTANLNSIPQNCKRCSATANPQVCDRFAVTFRTSAILDYNIYCYFVFS